MLVSCCLRISSLRNSKIVIKISPHSKIEHLQRKLECEIHLYFYLIGSNWNLITPEEVLIAQARLLSVGININNKNIKHLPDVYIIYKCPD
jgi:hypothetical protein